MLGLAVTVVVMGGTYIKYKLKWKSCVIKPKKNSELILFSFGLPVHNLYYYYTNCILLVCDSYIIIFTTTTTTTFIFHFYF